VPFVERSVELCAPGGRIGLVLPNKLLAADYAAALRAWLAERVTVEMVADYSDEPVFDASVYPVAMVMRREAPHPAAPLIALRAGDDLRQMRVVKRSTQADLHAIPGLPWSAPLDPGWEALKACFAGAVPLGDVAELSAGLTVGEAYLLRDRVADAPLGAIPADGVRLVTTGTVDRHRLLWGEKDTRFLRRRYRRPVVKVTSLPSRRQAQARAAKIIVAGMGLRPRAALDGGLALASVATVIVVSTVWPHGALCAVLNSEMVARLYRAMFGGLALSGGYLRFGQRELALIPLPDVPASDPRLARLDALALERARADHLARADLDAQIDRLVTRLYRLPGPE
jgi:hypothetical protein